MNESPLFARAYDLAKVTMQLVESFPRSRRAVLGRRLEEASMDFHARILAAAKGAPGALAEADAALGRHQFALRLANDLGLL